MADVSSAALPSSRLVAVTRQVGGRQIDKRITPATRPPLTSRVFPLLPRCSLSAIGGLSPRRITASSCAASSRSARLRVATPPPSASILIPEDGGVCSERRGCDRRSPFTSAGLGSRCERKHTNERHSYRPPLECFATEDGMGRGSCQGAHVSSADWWSFVRRPTVVDAGTAGWALVVRAALYRLPPISFPSDWTRWPASCCLSRLARMTPNEINGRVMADWWRALEFTGGRGTGFFLPTVSPFSERPRRRGQQALLIMHPRPLSPGTPAALRLAGHAAWARRTRASRPPA